MMRQIFAVTPGSTLWKSPPIAEVLWSCEEERKKDKMILAEKKKAMRLISTHTMHNATIIVILTILPKAMASDLQMFLL